MAVRTVTFPRSLPSIHFPSDVIATPCKKITHRYLEHTSHGVQPMDVSYNRLSLLSLVHEYCVDSKTNSAEDFAIRSANTF